MHRNARFGMTRFTYRKFGSASSDQEWQRAWMLETPRWRNRVRYAGRNYTLVNYEALSVNDECPVDILELRNPVGVRVAWAEIFHLRASESESPVSTIKELFVWPSYRRRGYGTIIEAAARILAANHSSKVITIDLYEPDARRPSVRRAPRLFALSRNYTWRWRSQAHPPRVGYARSSLDKPIAPVLYLTGRGYRAETSRATSETVRQ